MPSTPLVAANSREAQVWALRVMCALGLMAALPTLAVAGFLPEEADALDYRRPLLEWLLVHRTIPDWPWSVVDDYPMLGELVMAPLHAVFPGLPRLVPMGAWLLYVATCGGLAVALLPQHPSRLVWWQGAAAGAGFRLAYQQVDLLMVDLPATALMLASLLAALRFRLRLAGWLTGMALATRYSVWPLVPVMFAVALWKAWTPQRRRELMWWCILAGLPVAPFALRNLALHGNPVFPLLARLPDGTAADAAVAYASYGTGTTLLDLVTLPWNLLWTHHFVRNLYDYSLGKLFLLELAVVVALLMVRRPHNQDADKRTMRVLVGLSAFHALAWFYTAQQARFLTFGLTCLLLACLGVMVTRLPGVAVSALLLLGLGTYRSVQVNAWQQMASGVSAFQAQEDEARRCRPFIPEGAEVGHTKRGMGALLQHPVVYLPPHPYALPVADLQPEFVWGSTARPGYAPYPAEAPCLLRHVTP